MGLLKGLYLFFRGVAHIVDGVVVLVLVETDLEGQDGVEMVYVALDVLDAMFLPCPYLGGDVIMNG